jgi:MoxR-like ATPase
MAKIDNDFRGTFESKLTEMYPDTATTGVVSRPQLLEVMSAMKTEKYPLWLMKDKVGRGLYAIGGSNPAVVGNTALKPEPVIESFVVDYTNTKALIPVKDPNFVPFGNFTDLENIIKSGIFYPAYISGPTGNGKSTMVEQICAKHKKPLIRVNLNMMTDEEQLIGSKTLIDGNVEIVEGPVLIAMRTGTTLLLDEIDAGSANTLLCLQPILEGKPYYFKLKNEMIVPASGFNIIATANTKGKGSDDGRYIGTNILNEAFLERFAVTFEQEYPNAKIEVKIVKNLMETYSCLDEEFAETLVKWADAIRRTFEDGGVDETITTRRMIHIVRAFAIFKSREKAVELCCNRFDAATKSAFIDLFDKVANPQPEPVVVAEEPKKPESDEVPF